MAVVVVAGLEGNLAWQAHEQSPSSCKELDDAGWRDLVIRW